MNTSIHNGLFAQEATCEDIHQNSDRCFPRAVGLKIFSGFFFCSSVLSNFSSMNMCYLSVRKMLKITNTVLFKKEMARHMLEAQIKHWSQNHTFTETVICGQRLSVPRLGRPQAYFLLIRQPWRAFSDILLRPMQTYLLLLCSKLGTTNTWPENAKGSPSAVTPSPSLDSTWKPHQPVPEDRVSLFPTDMIKGEE